MKRFTDVHIVPRRFFEFDKNIHKIFKEKQYVRVLRADFVNLDRKIFDHKFLQIATGSNYHCQDGSPMMIENLALKF